EFGIVTVWVRAHLMSTAFARVGIILDGQRYSYIGTLHGYAEQLVYDHSSSTTKAERALAHFEDPLLGRYDTLKASALARGDGLHEVWLGDIGHHLVTKPDCAQAA
ncbi:MAG TPA: hypothetical protein VE086_06610, partial [Chthoniobacterales bacterium]|nr:hypothetical protein [Chthoniobacterales bacterium]